MAPALDAAAIYTALGANRRRRINCLDVLDTVPSTNSWLIERSAHEPGEFHVVLAEQQTAGRGQHGNRWISPPGTGLTLSLGYTFATAPDNLSCLTLAAGVAVAQALESAGATNIKLKWPNDIYAGDAKLGGILTEAQSRATAATIVCGIGLNLDLGRAPAAGAALAAADYPVTDLAAHCAAPPPANRLAAAIIAGVVAAIGVFEEQGFAPFAAEWRHYDWLRGKRIISDLPESLVTGVADGVDARRALQVREDDRVHAVVNGTVRVQAGPRA